MKTKICFTFCLALFVFEANAQSTSSTPSQPLKSQHEIEMNIQPANALYQCLDVNVAERFWVNYKIKIFEQFPDYPRIELTGSDVQDYNKYSQKTQEYLNVHRNLYDLIKKAEAEQIPISPH